MIAALLLTLVAGQDLEAEAQRLVREARYVEALAVLQDLQDPARAGLQRGLTLWAAGDLGGALRAGLEGLALGGDAPTRRQLLRRCTDLALELGEASLALDLVTRWEEALASAGDLTDAQRTEWTEGWGPGTGSAAARARAEALVARLDATSRGVDRARVIVGLVGLAALVALGGLSRR